MEFHAFQALVETAGDVIYRLDRGGRIRYVNEAVSRLLGYPPDEVLGKRVFDFLAPGGGHRIRARYRREIVSGEAGFYVELPVLDSRGRTVWLGQNFHFVRQQSRIVAVDVVGRDVTEHQRVAELQTGQKCLLELIARGKPLLDVLDTLACFLEAQLPGSAVILAGIEPNGNLLRPLVAPGLTDDVVQMVESVWEEKRPLPERVGMHPKERVLVTNLLEDEVWARNWTSSSAASGFRSCWTVPILSKDRTANGVLGLLHGDLVDPSEHDHRLLEVATQIAGVAIERERMERTARIELKRRVADRTLELEQSNRLLRQEVVDRMDAERALLRSQSLLKEAERIAHLGSWSWTVGEMVLLWSDEAFRIFGTCPEEFNPTPRAVVRLVHPDDRRRVRDQIAGSEWEGTRSVECRIVRPDGDERIVVVEVNSKLEDDRWRFVGIIHDITEQRVLEREILKAAERERKRVGRDLHDGLGQLLTGIGFLSKTLAETLEARGVDEADEAAEITNLVEDAIDHTRSLSKLLLPVELEENGLEGALQRLRSHVESVYGIGCRLKTETYRPIPDPEIALHLYRVAQEAVHNAVRHGKPDTISIHLYTELGKTVLSIADDGIGLPEDAEQLRGGLGLRTMQYRAQTIGATLTIARREGAGTQVTCDLPVSMDVELVPPSATRPARIRTHPANKKSAPKAPSAQGLSASHPREPDVSIQDER